MRARLFLISLIVSAAQAAVHSIETIERTDVAGGKAFGSAGPYERIVAKAHFTVDPKLPANRIIADIDLAPRNAAGLVEFAADIYMLKPADPAKGNGTVLFEVSNRGNKGLLGMFNHASGTRDPKDLNDLGDSFLLERGYTLLWVGWQADVPDTAGILRLYAPVATDNGKPLTGPVRAEFTPDAPAKDFWLGDRSHIPYPVLDPKDPAAKLTVRDRCEGERRDIPRTGWSFNAEANRVVMNAGFEPGKIYEVVYTSKDPVLVGLGPTAIRDMISYLKNGGPTAAINVLGDQRRFLKRAIGFGTSQSGRFLRTFLYYGFNADEQGRKVFDGVWAHVAGGGRGSFNHRFAQPSRDGHPHFNCSYPTDIFPFTDNPQTDPETGRTEGLLDKAMAAKAAPRIFYTNSSYEYWGRAAALIHSSLDGKKDEPLGADSRAYHFAGTQHGPGTFPPPRGNTVHSANGNDYRWMMRALLVSLNDWVTSGKEPPPSQIPLAGKDQLVATGALNWPKIPGSKPGSRPQRAWRADYGPDFRTKGIVTKEPPPLGNPFAALVPQVDADGNELSGIRAPIIQAPLATFTGWNYRTANIGAPDQLYSMVGSTILFPKTKAERQKTKDPRPSIEERYRNKAEYLAKFKAAAESLAASGYLLASDVPRIVDLGAGYWDKAAAGK